MKFKNFLKEFVEDFESIDTQKNDDSKFENKTEIFQILRDKFDVQTARQFLSAWKSSNKKSFKDFLTDLIDTIERN